MRWPALKQRLVGWRYGRQLAAKRRVLVWGDSNSCLPDRVHCWPGILSDRCGDRVHIFNNSVCGRTAGFDGQALNTVEILARHLSWYPRLDDVFVMLGTNDVKLRYGDDKTECISRHFRTIVEIINGAQPHVRPVLVLPPPVAKMAQDDFNGGHARITRLCRRLRSLWESLSLPILDGHASLDARQHLEADAVHLNAAGRKVMADLVQGYFVNNPFPSSTADGGKQGLSWADASGRRHN